MVICRQRNKIVVVDGAFNVVTKLLKEKPANCSNTIRTPKGVWKVHRIIDKTPKVSIKTIVNKLI